MADIQPATRLHKLVTKDEVEDVHQVQNTGISKDNSSENDNSFDFHQRKLIINENSVAVKGFFKWGMEPDFNTPSRRTIWVFQPSFCAARIINDPRYSTVDAHIPAAEQLETNNNAYRRPNVSFEYKHIRRTKKEEVVEYFDSYTYVTRDNVVEITTIFNINAGVVLLSDYGNDYDFDCGKR